jgi:hypothetical protein
MQDLKDTIEIYKTKMIRSHWKAIKAVKSITSLIKWKLILQNSKKLIEKSRIKKGSLENVSINQVDLTKISLKERNKPAVQKLNSNK